MGSTGEKAATAISLNEIAVAEKKIASNNEFNPESRHYFFEVKFRNQTKMGGLQFFGFVGVLESKALLEKCTTCACTTCEAQPLTAKLIGNSNVLVRSMPLAFGRKTYDDYSPVAREHFVMFIPFKIEC